MAASSHAARTEARAAHRFVCAWCRAAMADFAVGKRVSATFRGSSIPRTLGDLRRASIVLTLQLQRADMASSWYCEHALVEVRLEGSESFARYL